MLFFSTAGNVLGKGFQTFVEDPNKILMTAGGLTLFALGIYSARTTTGLAGKYLEARLGKPSLIRDTSRFTILDTIKHPIKTFKRFKNKAEDSLQGVVLEVSSLLFITGKPIFNPSVLPTIVLKTLPNLNKIYIFRSSSSRSTTT